MGYCKTIYRMGPVIEVMEYHSARYGSPGEKRAERQKATPEEMQKSNQRTKERKCWRKILANFTDGDYFLTFTYAQDRRPADIEEAKKDFSAIVRKIRKRYREIGEEVKWIRNIEQGSKGAWHIHAIINAPKEKKAANEMRGWIQGEWERLHGRVDSRLMNREIDPERGPFRNLADYITKSGGVKPKTGATPKETSFSTSRNLINPKPETKHYLFYKTWRKIRIPKGYDPNPIILEEGVNPWTGFRQRHYVLIKADQKKRLRC